MGFFTAYEEEERLKKKEPETAMNEIGEEF